MHIYCIELKTLQISNKQEYVMHILPYMHMMNLVDSGILACISMIYILYMHN